MLCNKQPMATKSTAKNTTLYNCHNCYFNCSKLSDWNRHILTAKHAKCNNVTAVTPQILLCKCGKQYKNRTGLWRHKQKCEIPVVINSFTNVPEFAQTNGQSTNNSVIANTFITDIANIEPFNNTVPLSTVHPLLDVNIVLELLKQNQEFKELLIEQNKQMIEISKENNTTMIEISKENNANLMEIAGKIGNTTNNMNSNNNTQFNLQVFLNEKCKDAVCIADFIKDISVSFQQLENIGKNGYVDGLVDVILSNLNKLDITKRPLHCSDIKRDTMHIKQPTEWTKDDNDNTMMTNIFRRIAYKNLRTIKAWSDENPISQESGTPENDFITGVMLHSLGAVGSAQTKMDNTVLKRIAKMVQIDKTM